MQEDVYMYMYNASFDYVLKLIFVFPGLMHMNVLAQHVNQSTLTYNKPAIPNVRLTYSYINIDIIGPICICW